MRDRGLTEQKCFIRKSLAELIKRSRPFSCIDVGYGLSCQFMFLLLRNYHLNCTEHYMCKRLHEHVAYSTACILESLGISETCEFHWISMLCGRFNHARQPRELPGILVMLLRGYQMRAFINFFKKICNYCRVIAINVVRFKVSGLFARWSFRLLKVGSNE